ncbi:MAG TPA: amidohydrolase [Firmicutes bacterium]|nr:amidohydrolase [Bacillota bacterium]
MRIYRDLAKAMDSIPIVDTHEHLIEGPFNLRKVIENSYVWWVVPGSGVKSSGYTKSEFQGLLEDRWWDLALERLKAVSNTAFFRHLLLAFKDLYDFDFTRPTREGAEKLSERIWLAYHNPGWYDTVVRDKAGVDIVLHDKYWVVGDISEPKSFYKPVIRLDSFLYGFNPTAKDHDGNTPYSFAERIGYQVSNFDEYLGLIDEFFERGMGKGIGPASSDIQPAVALKCASAYDRPLSFGWPSKEEAEDAFARLWRWNESSGAGGTSSPSSSFPDSSSPTTQFPPDQVRKFQDYVFQYAVKRAIEYDLPIQIHTGLASLNGSNPVNLWSLIKAYPEGKFILLHGGYPWTSEAGAMAASFENVYVDLCWIPVISPEGARRALSEWIEVIPSNRILWGGDAWSPEALYGSARMAKDVVTQVLSQKVGEGYLSMTEAVDLGERIFRDNALALFSKIRP